MKFFIPDAKDDQQALVYNQIVRFNDCLIAKISSKKNFSINYNHNGKKYFSCIGEMHEVIKEPIIAILETDLFLMFTPNRGVLKGEPILIGRNKITAVKEFE